MAGKQHKLPAMPSALQGSWKSASPWWKGAGGKPELMGTALATFNSRTIVHLSSMCDGCDSDPDTAPALGEIII